jgi:hypothetical protein
MQWKLMLRRKFIAFNTYIGNKKSQYYKFHPNKLKKEQNKYQAMERKEINKGGNRN